MFSQYMEELEKDPFVVEDFVEKLFWRTNGSDEQINQELLKESFNQTINDLKILQERQQRKCEKLETILSDEQKIHAKNIDKILERHSISVEFFQQLDEKINSVAGKIIHLGEQLENVNTPRTRTAEALRLLNHMTEFLVAGPLINDIFTNKDNVQHSDPFLKFQLNNCFFFSSCWKQLILFKSFIWLHKIFQLKSLALQRRKSSPSTMKLREI